MNINNRLEELKVLPNNWDPEGAKPPDSVVIEKSLRFSLLLSLYNLTPESISPSVEEGICFNFWQNKKYAAIEFLNDGSTMLLLSGEGDPIIEELKEIDWHVALDKVKNFLNRTPKGQAIARRGS